MEISIIVNNQQYSKETIDKWRAVWSSICEMCYNGRSIQDEIITLPGIIQIDDELITESTELEHSKFYQRDYCDNTELLLDTVWKEYSQKGGNPRVVPELEHIHVPVTLFYALGVKSWFAECFPNCIITLWDN